MCVCVCVCGGGLLEQTPLSFASLLLVAYIKMPEIHTNDVVSVPESNTNFLLMFIADGKCFFLCSINDIKWRGGGEGWGWGGESEL